jgi:hypothetical protein
MPSANKQVLVTFAPNQWKLVNPFVGTIGISQADTVRNIVIHWVLEHPTGPDPTRRRKLAPEPTKERA